MTRSANGTWPDCKKPPPRTSPLVLLLITGVLNATTHWRAHLLPFALLLLLAPPVLAQKSQKIDEEYSLRAKYDVIIYPYVGGSQE